MTTAEWIIAAVMFAAAGVLLFFSIRSFFNRGFVLHNAYIYATEEERKTMNKKPYYRQTAIVFCLLSAVFIILGSAVVLQNYEIEYLQIPVTAILILYAVLSTKRIRRQEKK